MTSPDGTVPPATLTAINSNNVDNLVQLYINNNLPSSWVCSVCVGAWSCDWLSLNVSHDQPHYQLHDDIIYHPQRGTEKSYIKEFM